MWFVTSTSKSPGFRGHHVASDNIGAPHNFTTSHVVMRAQVCLIYDAPQYPPNACKHLLTAEEKSDTVWQLSRRK